MCNACIKYNLLKTAKENVGYLENPALFPLYDQLKAKMVELFGYQLKDALQNVDGLVLLEKEIPIQVEEEIVEDVERILQNVYIVGQDLILSAVLQELKDLSIDLQTAISITDEFALDYAVTRGGELISQVTETTRKQVGALVEKALKEGRSKKYLANEIYKKFDQYNEVRSALIAQQEIALAYGSSKSEQFQDFAGRFNQQGRKRSQSQNDAKVRPEHYDAQLEGRIPANQPFNSTGTMHEPHGYNCRCVVAYRLFKPSENQFTLLPYNSIEQFAQL